MWSYAMRSDGLYNCVVFDVAVCRVLRWDNCVVSEVAKSHVKYQDEFCSFVMCGVKC